MKILFDGRVCCDHFTGIGRYAFGLLRHLPPAFPEHEFIVAWNPSLPNRRFDWGLLRDAPNARLVSCGGSGLHWRDSFLLRSVALSERADLLHAPYFAGALASPIASVVTIYDMIPFETRGGLRGRLARWGLERAARSASIVITLTRAVRERVLDHFSLDGSRVTAIPPGVDAPLDRYPGHVSGVLGPYVLAVGVQKPHKNLAGLIDAMARSFPTGGAKLVLVGPYSDLTATLRARAASSGIQGHVFFAGPMGDGELGPFYRNAAAVALVSFQEGFGLPLAEAMSAGVPVVASDIPVLREVCEEAAIYVDPHSIRSIAEGIARAMQGEDREARIARGLSRAQSFSWAATVPHFRECYERAAA